MTDGNRCEDPESSTGLSSMLKRGSRDGRIGVQGFVEAHGRLPLSEGRQRRSEMGAGGSQGREQQKRKGGNCSKDVK